MKVNSSDQKPPRGATCAAVETPPITLPAEVISLGDQMDRALDKLRTVHQALAPESNGWLSDDLLLSIWGTLEGAIRDLAPVRNRLQGVEGGVA